MLLDDFRVTQRPVVMGPGLRRDDDVDVMRGAAPQTVVIPAKAGIQYAAASRLNHQRLWNTGSSAFADDDEW
jgi:hypothetical protein